MSKTQAHGILTQSACSNSPYGWHMRQNVTKKHIFLHQSLEKHYWPLQNGTSKMEMNRVFQKRDFINVRKKWSKNVKKIKSLNSD